MAVSDDGVQDAERQSEIGAGRGREVQARELGGRRPPRVDDDQVGAPQVLGERRHRLGRVGPGEQHDVGVAQIGDGERHPAIGPERLAPRGGGRGHAEPAVVVDLRRPERDAGELAEQVGLFVGQPPAAEDRDGVRSVCFLEFPQFPRDEVEREVPADGLEDAVLAHHRAGQAPRRRQELAGSSSPSGTGPRR